MRKLISREHLDYKYYVEVKNFGVFKHLRIESHLQSAKHKDVHTKVDFFLEADEFEKLKEALNSV